MASGWTWGPGPGFPGVTGGEQRIFLGSSSGGSAYAMSLCLFTLSGQGMGGRKKALGPRGSRVRAGSGVTGQGSVHVVPGGRGERVHP